MTSMGTKSLWSSSRPTGESSSINSLTPTPPAAALLPPPAPTAAAATTDWSGSHTAVAHVCRRRAKVGKSYIDTGDLIGARWGSTYTLSAGSQHLTAITE